MSLLKKHTIALSVCVLTLLLLAKFFWPLFVYTVPLGYDVGLYRYLFIRHATGFPPFIISPMDTWALGHPLGLFIFTSILMKVGLPVSWLIGWIWNLFPVLLALVIAWVTAKREGKAVGVLVLLAAILSVAYFDAFAYMYWKTLASLLWCVLSFHLLEKKSPFAVLTGILTVVTHHQTGLLFGLVFLSWTAIQFFTVPASQKKSKNTKMMVMMGSVILALGLVFYIPVWNLAVWPHILELLQGRSAPGGNFPSLLFYLRTEGILLAFGVVGFAYTLKKKSFSLSLWHLSVVWSAVFVLLRLLFYKRFFLHLDFFLLPFAAIAIKELWLRYKVPSMRIFLVCALFFQSLVTLAAVSMRTPSIDDSTYEALSHLSESIPTGATVLGLENETTPFLLGFLPDTKAGGPGFELSWSYDDWKQFILGTHTDRARLLGTLTKPVFVYAPPAFKRYYGTYADFFLQDACFTETQTPYLFAADCK